MKNLRLKFFLSLFLLFLVVISCDQQVDTSKQPMADALIKDKDFLGFMESAEEIHFKVFYRQRDLGTFEKVDASIARIKSLSINSESALRNKSLIVKEIGFKDLPQFDQIDKELQLKRSVLVEKYPQLLVLSSKERQELLLKVVDGYKKMSTARLKGDENNYGHGVCVRCYFNNCNSCGTGEPKAENPPPGALSGECANKLASCKQNKQTIRDASKNIAFVIFLEYLVLNCGSTAVSAGTSGLAFGPHGAALLGALAGTGCALAATLIYTQTLRLIEATYLDAIMDCENNYRC